MSAPMMASDANNPNFLGAHNPDAALVVKFYSKAVHQPFRSNLENRPIYEDVDYIQIFTPGNQLNIIDTPVRDEHRARFRRQWEDYKAGKGDGTQIGTPLKEWPFLSAAQAEELRGVKFYTVEQIAGASDGQLQSMGMIGGMASTTIRARAQAFLSAASGAAPTERLAAENAELKRQMEDMQKQLAALAADRPKRSKAEPKDQPPASEAVI